MYEILILQDIKSRGILNNFAIQCNKIIIILKQFLSFKKAVLVHQQVSETGCVPDIIEHIKNKMLNTF